VTRTRPAPKRTVIAAVAVAAVDLTIARLGGESLVAAIPGAVGIAVTVAIVDAGIRHLNRN
jgi:hypothetical protein